MSEATGPKTAEQIIRNLHNFNRKERDHLIKFALSDSPSHPQVSKDLWRAIRPNGGKRQRPNPKDIFVGMDYHLNWLYAALVLSNQYEKGGIDNQINEWPDFAQVDGKPIQPNQQDVDLLIAFPHSDGVLHLVLIEAKFGSQWKTDQFLSKTERLEAIKRVSDNLNPKVEIKWRFMLASPYRYGPKKQAFAPSKLGELPSWMTEGTTESPKLPYFQFGPGSLYHVKRERDADGSPWEVLPVNLRGRSFE